MWIKTSLIALGLAGAMAAAIPAPTLAQGVHIGPGGVGIDIGRPGYRERHYRGSVYDDYAYDRRYRGGCLTVTVDRDNGSRRTIRRCDSQSDAAIKEEFSRSTRPTRASLRACASRCTLGGRIAPPMNLRLNPATSRLLPHQRLTEARVISSMPRRWVGG